MLEPDFEELHSAVIRKLQQGSKEPSTSGIPQDPRAAVTADMQV